MSTILIVDDVPAMAEQYAYDLRRLGSHDVAIAVGGDEALETLSRENIDCVILDLEMPGKDGFAVLRAMKDRKIDVPVIVYTGTGTFDRCVQALRLGAYGFIDKADPVERVAREVESAIERNLLVAEVTALRREAAEHGALIGGSPAMQRLRDGIAKIAPIPSAVMIIGESGSGKELVAREIHRLSGREREPFIAVNCAALPENLVESELFGHERGAFTGAHAARKGAFESAGKGTIFLDEIGELPPAAQAKLLRVLEEHAVLRVGSVKPVATPARVITATHRDLEKDVSAQKFRQDLLFRLNAHVVRVPPLRERLSDVTELVDHLLGSVCARFGIPKKRLCAGVIDVLTSYDWQRNNVRELRNVVERMVIEADGVVIGVEDVPSDLFTTTDTNPEARTFVERKAEAERQIIVAALSRNDWHITKTAEDLGLADHASLLKIMRRHGLKRPS